MAEVGRVAPELRLCRGCRRFVWPDRTICDFCACDLDEAEGAHAEAQLELRRAMDALRDALAAHGCEV